MHGPTAYVEDPKKQRSEDPKIGATLASAAAGLRPANSEPENCGYKQLMIDCCLYPQFPGSLTRQARAADALGRVLARAFAAAGFLFV